VNSIEFPRFSRLIPGSPPLKFNKGLWFFLCSIFSPSNKPASIEANPANHGNWGKNHRSLAQFTPGDSSPIESHICMEVASVFARIKTCPHHLFACPIIWVKRKDQQKCEQCSKPLLPNLPNILRIYSMYWYLLYIHIFARDEHPFALFWGSAGGLISIWRWVTPRSHETRSSVQNPCWLMINRGFYHPNLPNILGSIIIHNNPIGESLENQP